MLKKKIETFKRQNEIIYCYQLKTPTSLSRTYNTYVPYRVILTCFKKNDKWYLNFIFSNNKGF